MLLYPIHQTIVRINLMITPDSFEPRISRYPQGDSVPGAEFLEFGHDAVGNDGGGFGVETVHHGFDEFELFLDAVVDEVGVDKDGVRGPEGFVVLEEERGGDLRSVGGVGRAC